MVGLVEEMRVYQTEIGPVQIRFTKEPRTLLGIVIGEECEEGLPIGEGSVGTFLHSFSLPPAPSEFFESVWNETLRIPAGETVTYGELALRAGSPEGSRAVGQVMSRNRFALVIPCHRVVPKAGGFGNYRWGIDRKRDLLEIERRTGQDVWRIL